MNNKQYESPEMEIILIDSEDVITASNPDGGDLDLDGNG